MNHEPGAIRAFLSQFPQDTPVALESVGNWYWIVDEIEAAGCLPQMAHAAKATMMMGSVHKTDKLDADGLATLLHNGTLPSVWIAPGSLRDEREMPRTRMALSKVRTMLKNRMHSTLAKYALSLDTQSEIYAPKWRPQLMQLICSFPDETRRCMGQELELLDQEQEQIHRPEARILERVQMTPTIQLIQSVPGPAKILSIVIDREVGSIDRFPSPHHFASYSGLVPRSRPAAGKPTTARWSRPPMTTSSGPSSKPPTSSSASSTTPTGARSTSSLSLSALAKGMDTPSPWGTVARYLAEATYWVLKKGEPYREPVPWHPVGRKSAISPKQGQART